MGKMLIADYSKCTGCRLCEAACSVNKNGAANPARARIAIIKWEPDCLQIPMVCAQCESAPCAAVCPVRAIIRDEALGRMIIQYDLCIGCRMCMVVCPFGAMGFDSGSRKIFKCDLCDGDPLCAKVCETGALRYEETTRSNRSKMRLSAQRLSELLKKSAA